jgi:hypothetical protein
MRFAPQLPGAKPDFTGKTRRITGNAVCITAAKPLIFVEFETISLRLFEQWRLCGETVSAPVDLGLLAVTVATFSPQTGGFADW